MYILGVLLMQIQIQSKADSQNNAKARALSLHLAHGVVETPVFMPVGTQGCIKALDSNDITNHIGSKIILANTYHMYLRLQKQGVDSAESAHLGAIERLKFFGGIHKFANFSGNYLSDSGGFQAFSLGENVKISDEGVEFKSHIDGSKHLFSPKKVLDIQYALNSDICMVLDELVGLPATKDKLEKAIERTIQWAQMSLQYHLEQKQKGANPTNHLFAIIQGGVDSKLRKECALRLTELGDFDGYAIGGLAVGESAQEMQEAIEFTTPYMPEHKPRYLMGVGTPQDILEAIARGVDMFDCVMPSRNARNASIFTSKGKLNIKSSRFALDTKPLDENCACYVCQNYSRAYLHHLYRSSEIAYHRLSTIHNLYFYHQLTQNARKAILQNRFLAYKKQVLEDLAQGVQ